MNYDEFKRKVKEAIPVGTILKNPGGGSSNILSYSIDKISYRRGQSTISVNFSDLFESYNENKGCRLTASDLKLQKPAVFDSSARPSGHSCNCTFLFLLLQQMALVDEIQGRGVRGNPFFVEL